MKPMLWLGVVPLLGVLNEKMRSRVNCFFFGSKVPPNEMEKVAAQV